MLEIRVVAGLFACYCMGLMVGTLTDGTKAEKTRSIAIGAAGAIFSLAVMGASYFFEGR